MDEELRVLLEEYKSKILKLEQQGKVEQFYTMSKDGALLIHKTIITDIKPMSYMNKVLAPKVSEERIDGSKSN